MRIEEYAYLEGFRVNKKGNLFNLNKREYKTDISTGKERFYLRRNGKTYTIYLSRLQAYQKFGLEFYDFKFIRHRNGNPLDSSIDNILLGKGSEIISKDMEELPKTKRAFLLGYRVDLEGNLYLNKTLINNKVFINTDGYKMFCIPFKFKRGDSVFIHRLQVFQKEGDKLFSSELVMHIDGNKLNNSYNNLRLGTYSENVEDITLDVKASKYLKSAISHIKYDIPFRNKLRKEFIKGNEVSYLSRKYKIPYSSVWNIVKCGSIV